MVPRQDGTFDAFARRVRRALGVPLALVTLVDEQRQVVLGSTGLSEAAAEIREVPLSHSFCQYVVRDRAALVVSDARVDDRVKDNLAVQSLGVVAYAGSPLITYEDRRVVGALCAIDHEPREWTTGEMLRLAELAREVSVQLSAERARSRDS